MKNLSIGLCTILLIFGIVGVADSALWDRGGGLIYDDVLDITWLQDANYAYTSGYWDSLNSIKDPNAPGTMLWEDAFVWAENLTYYDAIRDITWSDWRLPHALPVNGSNYDFDGWCYDGSTDNGFNISAPGSVYPGSTASEMAYMYYNNLNNLGMFSVAGNFNDNFGLINTGLFLNLEPSPYWSGTNYPPDNQYFEIGIPFSFYNGIQNYDGRIDSYAWAVMDGDVAAIPIPSAVWLFFSGLISILGFRNKFRKG